MRGRPREQTLAYFSGFALLYSLLILLLYISTNPSTAADWLVWLVMAIPLVLVAYLLFHFILSLLFFRGKDYRLDKVPRLKRRVRVALVLGVFNDFIPAAFLETIDTIRKSENQNLAVDFFIASDSDEDVQFRVETQFAKANGVTHLHRFNRRGQRPGAVNSWAARFLGAYDYFMVLDKDSVLRSPDPLGPMVRALEHPSNQDIGVLQSSMLNANTSTRYSNSMGALLSLFRTFSPKNDMFMFGRATYWGHNGLIRKQAYLDAGGFSEDHLCDDVIFTMKLDRRGWPVCYCTDIITYEYTPSDFISMRGRSNRWARANLGTLPFILRHLKDTSAAVTFMVFLPVFCYLNTVLLMAILIGGLFVPKLITMGVLSLNQASLGALTAGLALYALILIVVFLARLITLRSLHELKRISKHALCDMIISLNVLPSLAFTTLTYPLLGNGHWDPFRPLAQKRSPAECFLALRYEFLLGILLTAAGILLANQIWLITASLYLFNFLFGPLALYFMSKEPSTAEKQEAKTLL